VSAISFDLRDEIGNRFCIGCKIIIHYDKGKSHQLREIKLSGGHCLSLAFDGGELFYFLR
jgi:hypothetical protein